MLRVDYAELAVASKKLAAQGNDFENCINVMNTVISGLPQIWEAETCNQYVQQFQQAKPTLMDVRNMIQDMANQMDKISQNFRSADTDMARQMVQ